MTPFFSRLLPRLFVFGLLALLLAQLPVMAMFPNNYSRTTSAAQPNADTVTLCAGNGQTFSEDTASLVQTINVTGIAAGSSVSNATVDLNILHSWSGDVVATLSHGSFSVTLVNRPGTTNTAFNCNCGCPYDNVVGTFSDSAAGDADRCVLGDSGVNAANGPYKPIGPGTLAVFNGSDPNGAWTLTLQDRADDEGGSLPTNGFCMTIAYNPAPTAVTLAAFEASQTGDFVLVAWETVSELNNRGFNLYRGVDASGWDRQLNAALLPSQAQGSSGGFAYSWQDQADLVYGNTYYYWLEAVSTDGVRTLHGPVSVTYQMPTAVRLRGLSSAALAGPALPWVGGALAATAATSVLLNRRRKKG